MILRILLFGLLLSNYSCSKQDAADSSGVKEFKSKNIEFNALNKKVLALMKQSEPYKNGSILESEVVDSLTCVHKAKNKIGKYFSCAESFFKEAAALSLLFSSKEKVDLFLGVLTKAKGLLDIEKMQEEDGASFADFLEQQKEFVVTVLGSGPPSAGLVEEMIKGAAETFEAFDFSLSQVEDLQLNFGNALTKSVLESSEEGESKVAILKSIPIAFYDFNKVSAVEYDIYAAIESKLLIEMIALGSIQFAEASDTLDELISGLTTEVRTHTGGSVDDYNRYIATGKMKVGDISVMQSAALNHQVEISAAVEGAAKIYVYTTNDCSGEAVVDQTFPSSVLKYTYSSASKSGEYPISMEFENEGSLSICYSYLVEMNVSGESVLDDEVEETEESCHAKEGFWYAEDQSTENPSCHSVSISCDLSKQRRNATDETCEEFTASNAANSAECNAIYGSSPSHYLGETCHVEIGDKLVFLAAPTEVAKNTCSDVFTIQWQKSDDSEFLNGEDTAVLIDIAASAASVDKTDSVEFYSDTVGCGGSPLSLDELQLASGQHSFSFRIKYGVKEDLVLEASLSNTSVVSSSLTLLAENASLPSGVDDLLLWFDATDVSSVEIDGSNQVTKWINKAPGSGIDLTNVSSSRITYASSIVAMNNQPAMEVPYVNGNAILEIDEAYSTSTHGIDKFYTLIMVVHYKKIYGSGQMNLDFGSWYCHVPYNGDFIGHTRRGNLNFVNFDADDDIWSVAADDDVGKTVAFAMVEGTNGFSFFMGNDEEISESGSAETQSLNGATQQFLRRMDGYLGEILLYKRALTAEELELVMNGLGYKWGLTGHSIVPEEP